MTSDPSSQTEPSRDIAIQEMEIWHTVPVVLQDACCTHTSCPTYRQPRLSQLQFQTRSASLVQIHCDACKQTWHSLESWFSQRYPTHTEIMGLLIIIGSLVMLPHLPWTTTMRSLAAVALVLAIFQVFARLYQRFQRKRAYLLFAALTAPIDLFPHAVSFDELQQRVLRLPERFARSIRQSLLVLINILKQRGFSDMNLVQQSLQLRKKTTFDALQRRTQAAKLYPSEREHLAPLLHLLQQIELAPQLWEKRPHTLQDILDSLHQNLIDWPQAVGQEAQDIQQEIQQLVQEATALLRTVSQAMPIKQAAQTKGS